MAELINTGSGNNALLSGDYTVLSPDNHAVHFGATGYADTNFILPTNIDWILIEMTQANGIDGDIGQHIWSSKIDILDKVIADIEADPQVFEYELKTMIYNHSTTLCDIYEKAKLIWFDIPFTFPTGNWTISRDSIIPKPHFRFCGEVDINRFMVSQGTTLDFYIEVPATMFFIDSVTNARYYPAYTAGFGYKISISYTLGTLKYYTNEAITRYSLHNTDYWDYQIMTGTRLYSADDLVDADNMCRAVARIEEYATECYFAPGVFDNVTTAEAAFQYTEFMDISDLYLEFPLLENGNHMFYRAEANKPKGLYVPSLVNADNIFHQTAWLSWPENFGITSNCTNLNYAFHIDDTHSILSYGLPPGGWDTVNVIDVSFLFSYPFDMTVQILATDFSSAELLYNTLNGCIISQDITIDAPNAINIENIFSQASAAGYTITLKTPSVSNYEWAFQLTTANKVIIDTPPSGAISCKDMFVSSNINSFEIVNGLLTPTRISFSNSHFKTLPPKTVLDFSELTTLSSVFNMPYYEGVIPIDYDFTNVGSAWYAYKGIGSATGLDVTWPAGITLNLPNATGMREIFYQTNLIAIGDVYAPKATDIRLVVSYNPRLISIGEITWKNDDANVEANDCFWKNNVLKCLSAFDSTTPNKVIDRSGFFVDCPALINPTAAEVADLIDSDGAVYINANACP